MEVNDKAPEKRKVGEGKENVDPEWGVTVNKLKARKSPLPEGYPRKPLQDITDIVQPNELAAMRKPLVDLNTVKLQENRSMETETRTGQRTESLLKQPVALEDITAEPKPGESTTEAVNTSVDKPKIQSYQESVTVVTDETTEFVTVNVEESKPKESITAGPESGTAELGKEGSSVNKEESHEPPTDNSKRLKKRKPQKKSGTEEPKEPSTKKQAILKMR